MPALLSDCGVGWVGCRGRGNREGDLLPLSWPSSTQISWPLPASRVFQRVHSYCLRSSVSDLENAITTSSAPADQGKEPLAGPLVSGCSRDNTRWPGSPIHWSIMLVHCTVVPPQYTVLPRAAHLLSGPSLQPGQGTRQQPCHRVAGGVQG